MWRCCTPLTEQELHSFENAFKFKFTEDLRGFLLLHNAGIPSPGLFPTLNRERKLAQLLDLRKGTGKQDAWSVNERLRDLIGPKRIIIGQDSQNNFVCVERNQRQQKIVLWNHITDQFEECLLDIPVFLRQIG